MGVSAIIRIFFIHRPEPPLIEVILYTENAFFNVPKIAPHRGTKENYGERKREIEMIDNISKSRTSTTQQ